MTKIMFCTCTHADQDRRYGDHQRVFNRTKNYPDKTNGGWRCSSCDKVVGGAA